MDNDPSSNDVSVQRPTRPKLEYSLLCPLVCKYCSRRFQWPFKGFWKHVKNHESKYRRFWFVSDRRSNSVPRMKRRNVRRLPDGNEPGPPVPCRNQEVTQQPVECDTDAHASNMSNRQDKSSTVDISTQRDTGASNEHNDIAPQPVNVTTSGQCENSNESASEQHDDNYAVGNTEQVSVVVDGTSEDWYITVVGTSEQFSNRTSEQHRGNLNNGTSKLREHISNRNDNLENRRNETDAILDQNENNEISEQRNATTDGVSEQRDKNDDIAAGYFKGRAVGKSKTRGTKGLTLRPKVCKYCKRRFLHRFWRYRRHLRSHERRYTRHWYGVVNPKTKRRNPISNKKRTPASNKNKSLVSNKNKNSASNKNKSLASNKNKNPASNKNKSPASNKKKSDQQILNDETTRPNEWVLPQIKEEVMSEEEQENENRFSEPNPFEKDIEIKQEHISDEETLTTPEIGDLLTQRIANPDSDSSYVDDNASTDINANIVPVVIANHARADSNQVDNPSTEMETRVQNDTEHAREASQNMNRTESPLQCVEKTGVKTTKINKPRCNKNLSIKLVKMHIDKKQMWTVSSSSKNAGGSADIASAEKATRKKGPGRPRKRRNSGEGRKKQPSVGMSNNQDKQRSRQSKGSNQNDRRRIKTVQKSRKAKSSEDFYFVSPRKRPQTGYYSRLTKGLEDIGKNAQQKHKSRDSKSGRNGDRQESEPNLKQLNKFGSRWSFRIKPTSNEWKKGDYTKSSYGDISNTNDLGQGNVAVSRTKKKSSNANKPHSKETSPDNNALTRISDESTSRSKQKHAKVNKPSSNQRPAIKNCPSKTTTALCPLSEKNKINETAKQPSGHQRPPSKNVPRNASKYKSTTCNTSSIRKASDSNQPSAEVNSTSPDSITVDKFGSRWSLRPKPNRKDVETTSNDETRSENGVSKGGHGNEARGRMREERRSKTNAINSNQPTAESEHVPLDKVGTRWSLRSKPKRKDVDTGSSNENESENVVSRGSKKHDVRKSKAQANYSDHSSVELNEPCSEPIPLDKFGTRWSMRSKQQRKNVDINSGDEDEAEHEESKGSAAAGKQDNRKSKANDSNQPSAELNVLSSEPIPLDQFGSRWSLRAKPKRIDTEKELSNEEESENEKSIGNDNARKKKDRIRENQPQKSLRNSTTRTDNIHGRSLRNRSTQRNKRIAKGQTGSQEEDEDDDDEWKNRRDGDADHSSDESYKIDESDSEDDEDDDASFSEGVKENFATPDNQKIVVKVKREIESDDDDLDETRSSVSSATLQNPPESGKTNEKHVARADDAPTIVASSATRQQKVPIKEEVVLKEYFDNIHRDKDPVISPYLTNMRRLTEEELKIYNRNKEKKYVGKIPCFKTKRRQFGCRFCGKYFAFEKYLQNHMLWHTLPKKYTCKVCGKSFQWISKLRDHSNTHTGTFAFKCTVCGKGFTDSRNIKAHERTHTGEKPYKCQFCDRTFRLTNERNAHVRYHTGERPYKCTFCGKGFHTQGHRSRHSKIHTGENMNRAKPSKPAPPRPKVHACEYCGKKFESNSAVVKHRRSHTKEKPYACSICGRRFGHKSHRNRHERAVHSGIRPFKCTKCGKGFSDDSNRKNHENHVHAFDNASSDEALSDEEQGRKSSQRTGAARPKSNATNWAAKPAIIKKVLPKQTIDLRKEKEKFTSAWVDDYSDAADDYTSEIDDHTTARRKHSVQAKAPEQTTVIRRPSADILISRKPKSTPNIQPALFEYTPTDGRRDNDYTSEVDEQYTTTRPRHSMHDKAPEKTNVIRRSPADILVSRKPKSIPTLQPALPEYSPSHAHRRLDDDGDSLRNDSIVRPTQPRNKAISNEMNYSDSNRSVFDNFVTKTNVNIVVKHTCGKQYQETITSSHHSNFSSSECNPSRDPQRDLFSPSERVPRPENDLFSRLKSRLVPNLTAVANQLQLDESEVEHDERAPSPVDFEDRNTSRYSSESRDFKTTLSRLESIQRNARMIANVLRRKQRGKTLLPKHHQKPAMERERMSSFESLWTSLESASDGQWSKPDPFIKEKNQVIVARARSVNPPKRYWPPENHPDTSSIDSFTSDEEEPPELTKQVGGSKKSGKSNQQYQEADKQRPEKLTPEIERVLGRTDKRHEKLAPEMERVLGRTDKRQEKLAPEMERVLGRTDKRQEKLTPEMERVQGRKQNEKRKRYRCSHCPKEYLNKSSRRLHERIHTKHKRNICRFCKKGFSLPSSLTRHLRTHTGEKKWKCSFCQKRFSERYNLVGHERIHTGEKPYKCLECGMTFIDCGSLTKHARSHSSDRPYKCKHPGCNAAFKWSPMLKRHEQGVHLGVKYECVFCDAQYTRRDTLFSHERRMHSGSKPYLCQDCGRRFKERGKYKEHRKKHEGKIVMPIEDE